MKHGPDSIRGGFSVDLNVFGEEEILRVSGLSNFGLNTLTCPVVLELN